MQGVLALAGAIYSSCSLLQAVLPILILFAIYQEHGFIASFINVFTHNPELLDKFSSSLPKPPGAARQQARKLG